MKPLTELPIKGSYIPEEVSAFARTINKLLGSEPSFADRFPIDPDSDDLIHKL